MNKICVIGVYFGKMPNYFPLWLESCKKNPEIDFIIFSDNAVPEFANVKYYPMTIDHMRERASTVLGFDACLNKPYKCCDYKAIYGVIFSEYIKTYDYWGHCDFDLIFGDIKEFLVKYNLYDYDRFLALGHLSFYRNTEEVNGRYRLEGASDSYKEVYSTDKILVFDEIPGMTALYFHNGFSIFTKRVFADIKYIYKRYKLSNGYKLDKKPKNYKWQIFVWENGKTYREYFRKGKLYREEYMYVHFQKRPNFILSFDPCLVSAFYITNKGFVEKKETTTKKIIKKLNRYPGMFVEFFEWLKYQIKRYVKALSRRIKKVAHL